MVEIFDHYLVLLDLRSESYLDCVGLGQPGPVIDVVEIIKIQQFAVSNKSTQTHLVYCQVF